MQVTTIAPKAPADPDKIRAVLRANGLTQKWLADQLTVDVTLLSKWMRGSREMDWPTLTHMALELKVPWQELVAEECRTCHQRVA